MHASLATPRLSPRLLVAVVVAASSCDSTGPVAPLTGMALYVSNAGGHTVTTYAAGATGDAAPTATIGGPLTGMTRPVGVARDRAGRLYVSYPGDSSIAIYAAGATGEVAPIARIAGSNTGLPGGAIALDAAGRLYVGAGNRILVFAAGAAGNAAPVATIAGSNTGLDSATGVAVDAASQLYVANTRGGSITVYGRGRAATSPQRPRSRAATRDWPTRTASPWMPRVGSTSPITAALRRSPAPVSRSTQPGRRETPAR